MTDERRNPWRLRARREAFRNPWISIEDHDVVTPLGGEGRYGVVRFANRAIGVLPIDAEGFTWLVGQWRYPLGRYSWELPEGGAPLTEDPLDGAKRELKEETGLAAAGWEKFLEFDTSNCVADERAVAFLAWDLTAGEAWPDETEDLQVRRVPFESVYEDVMAGRIEDGFTVAMVLKARALALQGRAPDAISAVLKGS
ncbi:MAG: NUDIX hydrolase [Pseudomonadota bacterium]